MLDLSFYKGKKVFVTGHNGFKGSWLCRILLQCGAEIAGYSLAVPDSTNLYELADINENITAFCGDIRDYENLKKAFDSFSPEIVFHLAAQPIVREGYDNPKYTYETNVMGTVNLLECIRTSEGVRSVVNVTTDKVYQNNEWEWGYRENEALNGFDPYSNSKSCSELVTHSYKNSFFSNRKDISVSTARAGNVIGGGDFAKDRIIPDCIKSAIKKEVIHIRNPKSIRPYQHVIEPLAAYMMIAAKQYEDGCYAGCYNVGPNMEDCVTTGTLTELFCTHWGGNMSWEAAPQPNAVHEANFLKLDCSKLMHTFGWSPRWNINDAVEKTVEWSKNWIDGGDIPKCMDSQIREYFQR